MKPYVSLVVFIFLVFFFLALSLHASVLKPYGLQLNRLIRAGVHCLKRHFFEANHHALKGILLTLTQST